MYIIIYNKNVLQITVIESKFQLPVVSYSIPVTEQI